MTGLQDFQESQDDERECSDPLLFRRVKPASSHVSANLMPVKVMHMQADAQLMAGGGVDLGGRRLQETGPDCSFRLLGFLI